MFEKRDGAEDAGVTEVQDGAQFQQAVFHWGAGERHAVVGGQGADGLGDFGAGVFNVLGFIESNAMPVLPPQELVVAAGNAVAGDHNVVVGDGAEEFLVLFTLGAVVDQDFQVGGELFRLARPVANHAGGGDDQRRPYLAHLSCKFRCGWFTFGVVAFGRFEGEELQGFAQPHVVGEHGAEALAGHPMHPVHTAALIFAQAGGHAGGDGDAPRCGKLIPDGAADKADLPVVSGDRDRVSGFGGEVEFPQLLEADFATAGVVQRRGEFVDCAFDFGGVFTCGFCGSESLFGLLELAHDQAHRRLPQPFHVLGDRTNGRGVGQDPFSPQIDQAGFGCHQVGHFLVRQVYIADGYPPVKGHDMVEAELGGGSSFLVVAQVHVGGNSLAAPHPGQHHDNAAFPEPRNRVVDE